VKAVALLLLVAVVSLSTVPDGGYDPFRLTTLDPAPAGRGEVVDRSPLEWRPVPLLIFEGFVSGSGLVNVWSYYRPGWTG